MRSTMLAQIRTSLLTNSLLSRRLVWTSLLVLLVANVPIVLCMPLNSDTVYYDLQVQCLADGGVLYRDMIEPNLPGVIWIHMLVRNVLGESSVAIRLFDLLVFGSIVWLLCAHNPRNGRTSSASTTGCLVLASAWFYLSLSSWSHCQRDLWMLLPTLVAVRLRGWRLDVCQPDARLTGDWWFSVLEGLLWGTAFWIKPHVAVPALAVFAGTALLSGWTRCYWKGCGGVLLGGAAAGGIGIAWLVGHSAWPAFWEMQLQWNPEYVAARSQWYSVRDYLEPLLGFAPWSCAHLAAIPVAICRLLPAPHRPTSLRRSATRHTLLAALYLGWVVQSVALQHPFAYVHVPGVLLAMSVMASVDWPRSWRLPAGGAIAAVFAVALLTSAATHWQRLGLWKACINQGPALALRAQLDRRPYPYWEHYPAVLEYLRDCGVAGEDVLVYNTAIVTLYRDLDLQPPTKFVLTDIHPLLFKQHLAEIRSGIERAPYRLVVSDMSGLGLPPSEWEQLDPENPLPPDLPAAVRERFPMTQPVVFRSGPFLIHKARQPIGRFFD